MSNSEPAGFRSARRKAESLVQDSSEVSALLLKASAKAGRNRGPLRKIWDDLMTLLRLIRSWTTGRYRDIPWQTIVLAIAAVVYFVNPFDIIPDFIPLVGFLDDATVVGFVIASIRNDLEKFREWENAQP
jgi:uncharacterized membrane protein YkvA (DUF1232 family)